MGIFGITTGKNNIHFGTRSDVCYFCAQEKAQADRTNPIVATNKLKGTFEGKKLLKIPVSGTQVIICVDHIHKISDENREGTVDAE